MNENLKLDNQIRNALDSEPSEEVQVRLRRSMRIYAQELQRISRKKEIEPIVFSVEWWHSFPGQIAFALGSLMILIGFFAVHVLQPQTALSATIDAIRLSAECQQRVKEASCMRCEFRRDSNIEKPPKYMIQWSAMDWMSLEYYDPTQSDFTRIMVQKSGLTVQSDIDRIANHLEERERFIEEIQWIVNRFSNPESISRQIQGIWKIQEIDENESGLIRVEISDSRKSWIMVLQMNPSKLPVRLEIKDDSGTEIEPIDEIGYMRFSWNDFDWDLIRDDSTEKQPIFQEEERP